MIRSFAYFRPDAYGHANLKDSQAEDHRPIMKTSIVQLCTSAVALTLCGTIYGSTTGRCADYKPEERNLYTPHKCFSGLWIADIHTKNDKEETMTQDKIRALAKRFFDCVEVGDIDGLMTCYAPDAKIWHNTDELEQGPEDNRKVLASMVSRISDRLYDNRRVETFEGGFLQQHVLRGTRIQDGAQVALPACVICAVKDGYITRLDEYFDSARVTEFRRYA